MSPRRSTTVVGPASATAPETETGKPLFVASIGVRWRDLDAFNHVNNSNYSPTSKRHGCSG